MLSYRDFQHSLDHIRNYGTCNLEKLNQGTTANKIRTYKKVCRIQNGGWHFSYLGGLEAVSKKIQAYSHQELNTAENTNLCNIEKRMQRAFESHRLIGVELDETYPVFLSRNREQYARLLGPITPKEIADRIRRMAWVLSIVDHVEYFIATLVTCLIPVKKWRKRARQYITSHLFGQGW
jgi:hypothetical protein